jgi:hypothetical protein
MTQFAISYLCLSKGTPREGVAIVEALSEYPARQLFWELPQIMCVSQPRIVSVKPYLISG